MGSGFQDAVARKTTADQIIDPNDQAGQGIAAYKKKFELLMPKGGDADQIVADAVQMLESNPKLRECAPMSVLGGLVTISQLNLRPGVLGEAWLVPMWNKRARSFQATLVVGYQGYLKLAYNSEQIKHVEARTVYEGDVFDFSFSNDQLIHKPDFTKPKGQPIAFYAVVHLANGHTHVERPMTMPEMEEHRDKFAMARTKEGTVVGPWRDNFEAMARKTMILKALKYLPKSISYQTAEVVDSTVRENVQNVNPERAVEYRAQLTDVIGDGSDQQDDQGDGDESFPGSETANE